MKSFTDVEQDFDYSLVYHTTDATKLENVLVATTNCVALRGTIMQIIVNTMNTNPSMQEKLEEYALYEADSTYYNASYWTSERIHQFAVGIAEVNEFLSN